MGRAGATRANGEGSSRPAAGLVRLQRYLADAGVASRRAGELLIEEGRVEVNGVMVRALPAFIDPAHDRVRVDGRAVGAPERRVYVMLNKPGRTLTAVMDEPGAARRTVLDLVAHPSGARLFPVGRLDFDTTGLVLLTNDGELANRLTHPRYGVVKTYHAVVRGLIDDEALEKLAQEIYVAERKETQASGAGRAARVGLRVLRRDRDRSVLEVTLKEGRNRQVRRMLAGAGCPVKRLEHVAMGPLVLKGLALGAWRELTRDELRVLRRAARGGAGAGETPAGVRVRSLKPGGKKRVRKPDTGESGRGGREGRAPGARGQQGRRDGRA